MHDFNPVHHLRVTKSSNLASRKITRERTEQLDPSMQGYKQVKAQITPKLKPTHRAKHDHISTQPPPPPNRVILLVSALKHLCPPNQGTCNNNTGMCDNNAMCNNNGSCYHPDVGRRRLSPSDVDAVRTMDSARPSREARKRETLHRRSISER
jgi:hypothetical protein